MLEAILLVFAVTGSLVGTSYYSRFAQQRGIIAKHNFRTLHEEPVPRGGGIVFAGVFSLAVLLHWFLGGFPTWLMLSFGLGGAGAAIIGWIDDVHDVREIAKLVSHVGLAIWIFATFYQPLYTPLFHDAGGVLSLALTVLLLLFVPVWMINLYNFVDGIDGMAITASAFICTSALIVLAITGGDKLLMFVFALLAASSLGFLYVNLPPASVFMGDAGSIFLGYCFGALLITTVTSGQISIWTWLAILGYYIADTTTTTICRVFLVKKWYGTHRSHAYQNLARISRSHARVTYGVVLYGILWALPLSVWSAHSPTWGPVAAVLSLGPAVVWSLRFGPRLSSD